MEDARETCNRRSSYKRGSHLEVSKSNYAYHICMHTYVYTYRYAFYIHIYAYNHMRMGNFDMLYIALTYRLYWAARSVCGGVSLSIIPFAASKSALSSTKAIFIVCCVQVPIKNNVTATKYNVFICVGALNVDNMNASYFGSQSPEMV